MELLKGPRRWPRVLLGRAGRYDPEAGLAAAEKAGAWSSWKAAVADIGPEGLIRRVTASGLRGRGGAGFPTGEKWRACRAAPGERHYAVANGYEADPGASLDRTLMELDPHAVVEGLALAAFAVGATQAYLVVKAGYGLAARRLAAAIRTAEEAGYIGSDALGAGFDLHIELRPLAGAFVLGEETVLLRALEGKRAMPDQRPPYPATAGLWGEPTLVNNVETLAAVPWIVANGAEAYRAMGTDEVSGTTLVQLTGAVAKPGIVEVPLGTSVGSLVEEIGGGVADGATLKAVLVGGPSGGFLPAAGLDVALGYGSLAEAGAIMGSGSLVVADERACIVDLATLMSRFMSDESCGKCIPCRIGVRRLTEIGERFSGGRPRPTDLQLASDLSADIRDGSLCGHGITAPNPLMSGMRYFAQEFEDHIVRSTCPAGVCRPLRTAAAPVR
ncbi:MAG TPA: NADH-ubiquinone oxidoreductase-F iron-sulfur binding region domain-containing protein [Candidatus Limnocylindrales bacterium]|nr:NADH-ubiquinone oxidoreductase-F iron-sulfur binding region domain-containing protein [Candidatus Limnocylindrales bacterium]